MLRELVEAIDMLTAAQPLILVLEDLHWSDVSTLDFIAAVARRRESARLLLLGTYRPADVAMNDHPVFAVQHELQMHEQCAELPLTLLTEAAVEASLATRFAGRHLPAGLARLVYQRTEGHPLFMQNLVEYWLAQGLLRTREGQVELQAEGDVVQGGMPRSLRQMIERHLDRLPPAAQRVLEVGSVAGLTFSAVAVAAGLETEVMQIEAACDDLVRRNQLLRSQGARAWPDGTVAGSYCFVHSLYQEVAYSRVAAARRVYLHRQIGMRTEAGYGDQASDIAAELAMHFERGRDVRRAVTYLRLAADKSLRRYAYPEVIDQLMKGLALLQTLPETAERTRHDLEIHCALGTALTAMKSYAALEVERIYAHARELCQQVGETPQLFPVLWGLMQFYTVRAEFQTARTLGEQLLRLAQRAHDPMGLLAAPNGLGLTLTHLGELRPARAHLEQSLARYAPHTHHACTSQYGIDLGVDSHAHLAHVLWLLGYPEQALHHSHTACSLAQEFGHPFSLAHACNLTAVVHQLRGEGHLAQVRAEAGRKLAHEQGFALEWGRGMILGGWGLCVQGQVAAGLDQMRQGIAAYRATAAEVWWPYYASLLAVGYSKAGQHAEGLQVLAEAFAGGGNPGEPWWEAELHRFTGKLLLGHSAPRSTGGEAEHRFRHARRIARRQRAKSLELRAAMSLSHLWQQQGKRKEAHDLLAPVYEWFTEGLDTADLQDAKALLEELRS